jgi:hypothetical protein
MITKAGGRERGDLRKEKDRYQRVSERERERHSETTKTRQLT